MLGELEVEDPLAFLLVLPGDHPEGEASPLCAVVGGIVEGKEGAVAGEHHAVGQVVGQLADLVYLQRTVLSRDLEKGNDEAQVDTFDALVPVNYGQPVAVRVKTDVPHLLLELQAANLQPLLPLQQVPDLDRCREVTLLNELPQRYRHPVPALRHEYLPIFCVLAPGSPLLLNLKFGIVEEDTCSRDG